MTDPRRGARLRAALALSALLLGPAPLLAHEGADARLAQLDAALLLDPGDVAARLRRAAERRRAGDLPGAREDLAALTPTDVDPVALGVAWAQIELAAGDVSAADTRLAALPVGTHGAVHDLRAEVRERSGRAACDDRLAALALGPSPDRAAVAAGSCEDRPADLARALGDAEDVIGLVPQVRRLRVEATARCGDRSAALTLVDELLARHPSVDSLLLRADVSGADSDRRAAVSLARERLARRATPLRRLTLARALAAAGQVPEARRELAAVLAAAPDLPAAHELAAAMPPEDP